MATLQTKNYVYYHDVEKALKEGGWVELSEIRFPNRFKVFTHKKRDYYAEIYPYVNGYWCLEFFI